MINIAPKPVLDIDQLNKAINNYMCSNKPRYLIMNRPTLVDLIMLNWFQRERVEGDFDVGFSYRGTKVAICNDLKYGDIDIV